MNEFKDYINNILKDITLDSNDKKDLSDEIEDHLNTSKNEYMIKGFSEKEAIDMAIKNFGEVNKIKSNYTKNYTSFNRITRVFAKVLFALYAFVFLGRIALNYSTSTGFDSINLIPFKTISFYLSNYNKYNSLTWFIGLFGTMIALIPFGFLIPIASDKIKSASSVMLTSAVISISLEFLQHITRSAVADIDDVILSVLGGIIGYTLFKFILLLKKAASNLRTT